jgi:hypothetical protein
MKSRMRTEAKGQKSHVNNVWLKSKQTNKQQERKEEIMWKTQMQIGVCGMN